MNILNAGNSIKKNIKKSNLKKQRSTLLSRIFKNEDNQFYSEIIIKGFIWVLMFLVSLIALFIIFQEGYGTNKEVIVLNSKSSVYTDNIPVASNDNFEYTNKKQYNPGLMNKGSTSDNKLYLKNSSKLESSGSQNSEVSSNSYKNMDLSNEQYFNEDSQSTDTIDNLIRGTIGQDLSKQDNFSVPNNPNNNVVTNSISNKVNKNVAITVSDKVWLVTVFSGKEVKKARLMWKEIFNSNPNLFSNKIPYFIKTKIVGKGTYYRVSLGSVDTSNSLPYFSTYKEAATYCSYLKSNNVSCFVIEADKSLLKSLIDN